MRSLGLLAVVLVAASAGWAANPPELTFAIALPEGRTVWRQGELIPLTLRLSSSVPDRWMAETRMHDRIGRLNGTETFEVEPGDGVRDPLEGLGGAGGGMGGPSGGPVTLTDEPFEYGRDLNEWVRFVRPGTYRLRVTTTRVYRGPGPGAARAPVPLTSSTVTLRIVEADPAWSAARLAEATALFGPSNGLDSAADRSRRGARILRFLETEQAVREMAVRLGWGNWTPVSDLRLGILSSPHRAAALPLMEQRLTAAEQPVDWWFVDTLTSLWQLVREEPEGTLPEEGPERKAWIERSRERQRRREARRRGYYDQLAASLEWKTGWARSVSAAALSEFMLTLEDPPEWRPVVVQYLRDGFENFSVEERLNLLSSRWYEIAGPEMVPLLKRLYEQPGERRASEIRQLALRRLMELEPATVRQWVLEDIVESGQGPDAKTAALMEGETLPEAFEVFRAHLELGSFAMDQAVLRFGDASLADAAQTALEIRERQNRDAGQEDCLSLMHSFLLREDPKAGEPAFRRAFAGRKRHCLDLRRIVPTAYGWSPALERLLGEMPVSAVPVTAKESAAELLGRYGSAEAEDALWAGMEAFHGWWDGRGGELRENYQAGYFEQTLRTALALGNGWVLDAAGMKRLRGLCITDACRSDVDRWTAESAEPLRVSVSSVDPENFSVSVGRFHLRSMEALRAKAGQLGGARLERRELPGRLEVAYAEERLREVRRLLGLIG